MINNNGGQHTVLDWITRITPNRYAPTDVTRTAQIHPSVARNLCTLA